LLAYLRLIPFI